MKTILKTALVLGLTASPAAANELTVLTAGDQNMVDYVNEYLGPLFEKENPGTTVRVVGTGPGDAGSQKFSSALKHNPRLALKSGTPTLPLSMKNLPAQWSKRSFSKTIAARSTAASS